MLLKIFICWAGFQMVLLIAAVIVSGSGQDRRPPRDKDDIDYSGGQ